MADKEIKEVKRLVVTELPKQEVKTVTNEKGEEFELLTIDEALTEILQKINDIKKAVA